MTLISGDIELHFDEIILSARPTRVFFIYLFIKRYLFCLPMNNI